MSYTHAHTQTKPLMIKEKTGEWNKTSNFQSSKYTVKYIKIYATAQEKTCAKYKIYECLHHKYTKDFYLSVSIKQITQQNIRQEC